MSDKQTDKTRQKNEGEGSRTAARSYNKATEDFAKSGKVDSAAKKAKRAVDAHGDELNKAEKKGRERAKAFEPAAGHKVKKS